MIVFRLKVPAVCTHTHTHTLQLGSAGIDETLVGRSVLRNNNKNVITYYIKIFFNVMYITKKRFITILGNCKIMF